MYMYILMVDGQPIVSPRLSSRRYAYISVLHYSVHSCWFPGGTTNLRTINSTLCVQRTIDIHITDLSASHVSVYVRLWPVYSHRWHASLLFCHKQLRSSPYYNTCSIIVEDVWRDFARSDVNRCVYRQCVDPIC